MPRASKHQTHYYPTLINRRTIATHVRLYWTRWARVDDDKGMGIQTQVQNYIAQSRTLSGLMSPEWL